MAQADSIIPPGVQGLDRYVYANNNPILYNDPSGHCPICYGWGIIAGMAGEVASALTADLTFHFFGLTPDDRGIAYAEEHVSNGNALVASGLAVQSEWYISVWDDPYNPLASSYGPAQALQEELADGQNPHNPEIAVEVMTNRINEITSACPNCIARDKVILAALAQNGREYALNALDNVSNLDLLPNGGLDWEKYFNSLKGKDSILLNTRAIGRHNFDTRFQLHLFMNDLRVLRRQGWEMPNLSDEDWDYISDLEWGTVP